MRRFGAEVFEDMERSAMPDIGQLLDSGVKNVIEQQPFSIRKTSEISEDLISYCRVMVSDLQLEIISPEERAAVEVRRLKQEAESSADQYGQVMSSIANGIQHDLIKLVCLCGLNGLTRARNIFNSNERHDTIRRPLQCFADLFHHPARGLTEGWCPAANFVLIVSATLSSAPPQLSF